MVDAAAPDVVVKAAAMEQHEDAVESSAATVVNFILVDCIVDRGA